jgi:hypothetical protein
VGSLLEIWVLPDIVDECLGRQSGERLDKLLRQAAGSFLFLPAGVVSRRALGVLLGRGRPAGRKRIHVVIIPASLSSNSRIFACYSKLSGV